jgi:hypothetical protein
MTPGHCAGPRQVRGAVTSPSAAKILRPGRHPCGPGCSARMPPCWNVGLPRWPMRCAMTTPRTIAQRRADALGALGAGATQLACQCGDQQCSAAVRDERAGAVVIHVLADAEALEAGPDPLMSGEGPHRVQPITRDTSLAELMAPQSEGELPPPCRGSAVIAGGPAIPSPLLAQLVADGATVRHLSRPRLQPEPGYRPSAAMQAFVRMRDLTCRFPMCDVPADRCDIDHAIPWPFGPTHPSNLRCECRKHHLLKTFWVGAGDGRIGKTPMAPSRGSRRQAGCTRPVRAAACCFPTGTPTPARCPPIQHLRLAVASAVK